MVYGLVPRHILVRVTRSFLANRERRRARFVVRTT
jgi:hypothetical protein